MDSFSLLSFSRLRYSVTMSCTIFCRSLLLAEKRGHLPYFKLSVIEVAFEHTFFWRVLFREAFFSSSAVAPRFSASSTSRKKPPLTKRVGETFFEHQHRIALFQTQAAVFEVFVCRAFCGECEAGSDLRAFGPEGHGCQHPGARSDASRSDQRQRGDTSYGRNQA